MPKLYSVIQAAKLLGYSTNTIYSKLKDGDIHSVRIGKGRYKIAEEEIERLLGHQIVSTDSPLLAM